MRIFPFINGVIHTQTAIYVTLMDKINLTT